MLAFEHGSGLDDRAILARCDHGPELLVVAGDDLLAFHCRTSPVGVYGRGAQLWNALRQTVVCPLATVVRRTRESAPTAADTRRLAEEARARVRFEEEALELSD